MNPINPPKTPNEKVTWVNHLQNQVTLLALCSRLLIVTMQFLFNTTLPDYKDDGFISPMENAPRDTRDHTVHWLLGGFMHMDAQYFLQVFSYGYVFEHTLAFFPGYPSSIYAFSQLTQLIFPPLNKRSTFLVSATLFNIILFTLTARTLFALSYKVLKNEALAVVSTMLFCINPASVFFSAPYSETLFSFLSFSAMHCDGTYTSCSLVSLSAIVRSNGVVNFGFPLYRELRKFISHRTKVFTSILFVGKLCIMLVISFYLFAAYQFFSYSQFCYRFYSTFTNEVLKQAALQQYVLRGKTVSKMCTSLLPYFYVQKQYWYVGLFGFFELKHIPNFILTAPLIYLITVESYKYYRRNKNTTLTLGLSRFYQNSMFEYVVHLNVLLIICVLYVHIQVTIRLICSSSPALYWLAAIVICDKDRKTVTFSYKKLMSYSRNALLIVTCCLSYTLIGTALFSNGFPWT